MVCELLEHLAPVEEANAHEVAEAFGVPYPVAAMALLRLVRQGLAARSRDPNRGTYRYEITDRGGARLQYLLESDEKIQRWPPPRQTQKGETDMKRKKTYTGTFHCPSCFIEYDLTAEESLQCDKCKGPLAEGSLDQVWDDEEED